MINIRTKIELNKLHETDEHLWLEKLENIYQTAVFIVTEKTGLNQSVLPENFCYSLSQLLNKRWLSR